MPLVARYGLFRDLQHGSGQAVKFPVVPIDIRSERVKRGLVAIGPGEKKLSCFRYFRLHQPVKPS